MDMPDAQVDDNSSVSLVSISRMKSDEDHVDSSGSTITLRKESLHDLVSKELLNRAAEVQEIIVRKMCDSATCSAIITIFVNSRRFRASAN